MCQDQVYSKLFPDLDDPPPEHLSGYGLATSGFSLCPHDPLGEHHRAAHPVPEEHLGQGLLVFQQSGESISGYLRQGRDNLNFNNVKLCSSICQ